MKKKVAIQGIAGSYHDIAARNYHEGEEIEIIPCNTFRDVITTIKKDPSNTNEHHQLILACEEQLRKDWEKFQKNPLCGLAEWKNE